MKTGHPRPCTDSYEARSTGSLDPRKLPTRTTQGRADRPPSSTYLLTKAFNATTSTNVATSPPAWEHHPRLIPLFTAHPGMGGEKVATIHTTSSTVLPTTPPQLTRRQPPRPGFLGLGLIRFSPTPPQSCPDQASSVVGQQKNDIRTSIIGDCTVATGPRAFHHPVINVTTISRGWPTITRARRHSDLYSTRRTFTSKAPP
jgi:hypothetical protein